MPAVTIDELTLADDPVRWSALGFTVAEGCCQIGSVRLRFVGSSTARDAAVKDAPSIVGWSLREAISGELDGLPTTISTSPIPEPAPTHANGVFAVDHIVAASPELDRTVAILQRAGLDLRRVREQPTPTGAPRQAFFRLGSEILELIQEPDEVIASTGGDTARPARFWGLALLVEDFERASELLGDSLSDVRPAVQAGRRIASVRRSAGLALPLALMSPKPPRESAAGRA